MQVNATAHTVREGDVRAAKVIPERAHSWDGRKDLRARQLPFRELSKALGKFWMDGQLVCLTVFGLLGAKLDVGLRGVNVQIPHQQNARFVASESGKDDESCP